MNQILTFQLSNISQSARISENPGNSQSMQFPLGNLSVRARTNLSIILTEKQALINKAIPGFTWDVDHISIRHEKWEISSEEREAYHLFLEKLLETACNRKWVVPKRKSTNPVSGEKTAEKYLFRIWLNQLGMKGARYAGTRKILTRKLSGCSAWPSEEKMEAYNKQRREARRYERNTKVQSFIPL